MQGIAYHHPKGVYHQPLGCINGETGREDFPLTEKDLDKWLEEDDDIDDWDKFQIFYKNLNSGQMSVVGGQQDCYTEYDEVNGLGNTNPIQQENKEYNKLPPKAPLFRRRRNHAECVYIINAKHCISSPKGCISSTDRLYVIRQRRNSLCERSEPLSPIPCEQSVPLGFV